MNVALRKMGNSSGVIIPKPLLAQLGVKAGDDLDLALEAGRLVLTPAKPPVRAGWAEAAQKMAEAGEDGLVWPEFGNEGDDELEW